MSKKFTVLITVVATAIITSLLFILFFYSQQWINNLKIEGAKMAIQSVIDAVKRDGVVSFQTTDKDGKKIELKLKLETNNEIPQK